jgi:hypothetical protein
MNAMDAMARAQQLDGKIPADKLSILKLISGPEALGRACLIYAIIVMIHERELRSEQVKPHIAIF